MAIDDPVARLLSRYFTISTPKRKMDHSPGELEGEIDHLSRDAAVEYLLMPERVKKLGGQILGLSTQVEDLQSDLVQLKQILSKLGTLEEPDKKREVEPVRDESRGYIC